ncbi:MAG: TolC family protein, partial [Colwellia sp.]|nr:TolC family protein [Colwellia sp.]
MKIKSTLLLGLFAASSYSQVQTTPTLQALADSIKQYHPQIQAMIAKRKQAGFAELEAQGAFDANISQTTQLRLSGYY